MGVSATKATAKPAEGPVVETIRDKIRTYPHLKARIYLQLLLHLHERRYASLDDIYEQARREAKTFHYNHDQDSPNVGPEQWSANERQLMHRLTLEAACKYLTEQEIDEIIISVVKRDYIYALENIANSNALYHNMEHTVLVTMAGQAIIEGKHLIDGEVTPKDWLNYTIALLCHDIGYVKGVLKQDNRNNCATGVGSEMVDLPEGGTDIALTPYHVDRSKQFVRERFGKKLLGGVNQLVDVDRITDYIELTRFPPPEHSTYKETNGYAGLTRAADFIGQLGDPHYLRKTPALFYEFEETNANDQLGYRVPGDLSRTYAGFFWNIVNPYIKDALRYLAVTQEGKQWIASLYSHVFTVEHAVET